MFRLSLLDVRRQSRVNGYQTPNVNREKEIMYLSSIQFSWISLESNSTFSYPITSLDSRLPEMKKYIFSLSITGQKTNELKKMGQIPMSSSAYGT